MEERRLVVWFCKVGGALLGGETAMSRVVVGSYFANNFSWLSYASDEAWKIILEPSRTRFENETAYKPNRRPDQEPV